MTNLVLCRTGVYILQKYKFYSLAPPRKVRFFFPRFFLKSAKKGPEKLKHRADPPLIIDFLCSMILNKKGFPIAKQTNWPCLQLKPNQKRSFKNLQKHLDEFLNHLINMQTNKQNLPKVYSLSSSQNTRKIFHNTLSQIKLKIGIGYRGRCLSGVTPLKVSHGLTRVTGSSSIYQRMERILFPVLL